MVWQIAFATTSCLPSSPMSEFPPFKIRRRDASSWNALVASCLRPSVLTVSNHRMIFTYDDDTSLKLHCLQSQTKDLDWVRMQIEEQQLVTGDETNKIATHTQCLDIRNGCMMDLCTKRSQIYYSQQPRFVRWCGQPHVHFASWPFTHND